jgi:hypothetical protein
MTHSPVRTSDIPRHHFEPPNDHRVCIIAYRGRTRIRRRLTSSVLVGDPMIKKRTKLPRHLYPDDRGKAVRRHATILGEILWAWNDLHRDFAMIFTRLAETKNPSVGPAIWAAINTDRSQRETLAAIAPWALGDASRRTNQILWAIKAANSIATYRNDLVHSPMGFRLGSERVEATASYFGNPFNRIIRLKSVDMDRLVRVLRDDIVRLDAYVAALMRAAHHEKPPPLPRRPRMRSPRLFPDLNLQVPRRKKRARLRPRGPSSL